MPNIKLPYNYIAGLPPKAQQQIWRDFQEVIGGITTAGTVFDAVIDPTLAASRPSEHVYVNLVEAEAAERVANNPLVIGVRNTNSTITEPAGFLVMQCDITLVCFAGGFIGSDVEAFRPIWDLHGLRIQSPFGAYNLSVFGLHIKTSAANNYVLEESGS